VHVTTHRGTATLANGFQFTPSLNLSGDTHVGGSFTLDYWITPGDALLGVYGLPPEISIETPPWEGRLCIANRTRLFYVGLYRRNRYQVSYSIPDDPNLSGVEILFQGLAGSKDGAFGTKAHLGAAYTRIAGRAWTNCVRLVIE